MSRERSTPEQKAAIEIDGSDVLLEAGAGTGKTGVMVDRYCRLVCEEKVSPDSILAFTFTDKAAAELRERIRAELALRAGGDGSGIRARDLLSKFAGAWITTIHGFCNRLLAGHPVAAGIEPRFRVLDAAEAQRAAREAFDEAVEVFLAEGAAERERTVAAYTLETLRATIVAAHDELRSRGVERPSLPPASELDPSPALRTAHRIAAETLAELKPDDRNRPLLERAVDLLAQPAGEIDVDRLASLRSTSKAKKMEAYCEAIDTAVARVFEAGEGGETYAHLALLLDLYGERYREAKDRRSGVDFEDLQIVAARLLERPEIGSVYRERFKHLLVDEFQDTNRLQLRLIDALRGPQAELMAVGDEFQSIYGFRHADLEVFRRQRQLMDERPDGKVLALSGNFRARPALIAAVNELGKQLLGPDFRPLRVGKRSEGGDGEVELRLTAADGWDDPAIDLQPAADSRTSAAILAESRDVALRLRELADAGVPRGEMVVLLRAFTHLDAYEDSLERAGLSPYVLGGRGYWSQQQVADVCALLGVIANPLDDRSLFSALASPACGLTPDTLWLLRQAAGPRRHVWPAVEVAAGREGGEHADASRIEQIPASERALLQRFVAVVEQLRALGSRLSLAALIDEAIAATGYDLAVLGSRDGEARYANVRKLMRLAADFESHEGRDLRGLLEFLSFRTEAAAESTAATAAENHDGVRVMTVHNAKGLEFGTVAVPGLSRTLLAGSRQPLLALGRGEEPAVGLQLRRLGARSIDLFEYRELCRQARVRDSEEALRLFYVAATRAQERLILSGVVGPKPRSNGESTPVIERIVAGLELDRSRDSTVTVAPAQARDGLDETFAAAQIQVSVNSPSPERAALLREARNAGQAPKAEAGGAAPLIARKPTPTPNRPLSYSAISAYESCAYRFRMERILGLPPTSGGPEAGAGSGRRRGAARGTAVHGLLEWSHANGWQEPPAEVVLGLAASAGLGDGDGAVADELLAPIRGWLGSELMTSRIAAAERTRTEVPFLLDVDGSLLRGSIDLLAESQADAPLIVDYKSDRLDGEDPASRAPRYEVQRSIYALAVAEATGAEQVELAYVFLERPHEPLSWRVGREELEAARSRLAAVTAQIAAGKFPVADPALRSWELCRGCPALGRLCSGPEPAGQDGVDSGGASSLAASSSSRSSLSPSPTASSSAAQ